MYVDILQYDTPMTREFICAIDYINIHLSLRSAYMASACMVARIKCVWFGPSLASLLPSGEESGVLLDYACVVLPELLPCSCLANYHTETFETLLYHV